MGTSFRKEGGLELDLTESTGVVTESGTERRRSRESSCASRSSCEVSNGKKSLSSPPLFGWPITKAAMSRSSVSGPPKPVLSEDSDMKKHNSNVSGQLWHR